MIYCSGYDKEKCKNFKNTCGYIKKFGVYHYMMSIEEEENWIKYDGKIFCPRSHKRQKGIFLNEFEWEMQKIINKYKKLKENT